MKRRRALRNNAHPWRWAVWLLAAGLGLAAVVGSGVDPVRGEPHIYKVASRLSASPSTRSAAAARFQSYVQAPELDADANLPPLDERLPLVPLVLEDSMANRPAEAPRWELGTHGGQLWLVEHPVPEFDSLTFMLSENFLGAPGLGMQGLYGNLAEEYYIHPANTHYRLTLRQGLKWSGWHSRYHRRCVLYL